MIYDNEVSLEKYKENPIYNWSVNGYFEDKIGYLNCFMILQESEEIQIFLDECKDYKFICDISEDLLDKDITKPLITSSLQQLANNMVSLVK